MKRRESSGRGFKGACGVLTGLLLSACEPSLLLEQRFTQDPSNLGAQAGSGVQSPSSPPSQESPPSQGQSPQAPSDDGTPDNAGNGGSQNAPRSWYVSMKGTDVGKGTQALPLRTIARAASLARPGDVIRVMPGTYSESLVLESRGTNAVAITLRGEGTARPTITPANRAPGALIFVRGNWNLENLHLDIDEAPMAALVFHVGADGSRLADSELRDGRAGAGVIVQGARNVVIEDNLIHHFIKPGDDSHGIVVVGPSRNTTVRNNNIHHNSGDSVQCQAGSAPAETLLVQGNELHDNGENGVDIKQCYGVTVRDNEMYGFPNTGLRAVGSSAGEAVLISRGARDVLIQGNDISRAGRGISVLAQVATPRNIRLEGNTIQDIRNFPAHNGQGIRVAGGQNVQVVDNVVERTASYGLMLAADGLVVQGLTVRYNRVRPSPQQPVLLRLGREAYRPGLVMRENHYGRNGRLSMDGIQDKFHGPFADYHHIFSGEELPLSGPERMDVWRLLVGVEQGSDVTP